MGLESLLRRAVVSSQRGGELPVIGLSFKEKRASGTFKRVGSGVIVAPQGYFVTNAHVIQEDAYGYAQLPDKSEVAVRMLYRAPAFDLAFGQCLLPYALHDIFPTRRFSSSFNIGDPVFAYRYNGARIVRTRGVVSRVAVGEKYRIHKANGSLQDPRIIASYALSTCDVYPGWSGGPVVLARTGELVGLTSKMMQKSKEKHIFIKASYVQGFLEKALRRSEE